MDDGVVAGSEKAAARVIAILKELGPHLGLFLNVSKCEVFSKGNMNSFPQGMKRSNTPCKPGGPRGSHRRYRLLC